MNTIKFRQPTSVKGVWQVLEEEAFVSPVNRGRGSQQFTGVLDTKGTEIYEGDRLRFSFENGFAVEGPVVKNGAEWAVEVENTACWRLLPYQHVTVV